LTLVSNANNGMPILGDAAMFFIEDDDELGLIVSTNFLRVAEGRTASFTVQLNGPPVDAPPLGLVVNLARISGDFDLQTSGSTSLRFNEDNWHVPQTFSISANNDADWTNGLATFTLSASGLSNVVVTAVEIDDDPPSPGLLTPVLFGAPQATGIVGVAFSYLPQASLYGLTLNRLNWTGAEGVAVALGGNLAAITSSREQSALERTFMTGTGDKTPYWIGLNDAVQEGTFGWSSGEPLGYANWNPGQPNNSGGNQDYVAANYEYSWNASSAKGTWSDMALNGASGTSMQSDGPYHGIMELPLPGDTRFYATNLPAPLSIHPLTGAITGTPVSTGLVNVTIAVVTTNGVADQEIVLNLLPLTYARWMAALSNPPPTHLRGPADDPDGDGLPNATEYAFNLPPMSSNARIIQASLERVGTNRFLTVDYRQFLLASEAVVRVERATSLNGPWTTDGLMDESLTLNHTKLILTRSTSPVGATGAEFLRVSVELRP